MALRNNFKSGGGFPVENAIILDRSSASVLNRDFTAGDRGEWLYSMWFKRAQIDDSTNYGITGAGAGSSYKLNVQFKAASTYIATSPGNIIAVSQVIANTEQGDIRWTGQYKDPSKWQHLVVSIDTSQAASNRQWLYVDGVRITSSYYLSALPSGNTEFNENGIKHHVFRDRDGTYYDGYASEIVYLDGSSIQSGKVSITDFGEINPTDPLDWRPVNVSETVTFSGANTFYFPFDDPNDLGADRSGNGHSFARTNITSANHITDTPTNNAATLDPNTATGITLSNGNRTAKRTSTTNNVFGTFNMTAGSRWYYECHVTTSIRVGIQGPGGNEDEYSLQTSTGNIQNSGSGNSYSTPILTGTILGVAVDLVSNTIEFYYDNVGQGTFPIQAIEYLARFGGDTADGTGVYRFNEDEFTYAPPSGFNALMDKYKS